MDLTPINLPMLTTPFVADQPAVIVVFDPDDSGVLASVIDVFEVNVNFRSSQPTVPDQAWPRQSVTFLGPAARPYAFVIHVTPTPLSAGPHGFFSRLLFLFTQRPRAGTGNLTGNLKGRWRLGARPEIRFSGSAKVFSGVLKFRAVEMLCRLSVRTRGLGAFEQFLTCAILEVMVRPRLQGDGHSAGDPNGTGSHEPPSSNWMGEGIRRFWRLTDLISSKENRSGLGILLVTIVLLKVSIYHKPLCHLANRRASPNETRAARRQVACGRSD